MDKIDLTGLVFGRLKVLKDSGERNTKGEVKWLCVCNCGEITTVVGGNLRNKHSTACNDCGHVKDRLRKTPEGSIWKSMLRRCYNQEDEAYHNYGGRGITVCPRWFDDELGLVNFINDMGARISTQYSIDRIDNNGNYEPGNCRWATTLEQGRNRRNNKILTYNGRSLCQSEWAAELGISSGSLQSRFKAGWSLEKALTTTRKSQ